MLKSRLSEHVHWIPGGALGPDNKILNQGWYFSCEDYTLIGPYLTEKSAINSLNTYVLNLNPPVIDYDGRSDET